MHFVGFVLFLLIRNETRFCLAGLAYENSGCNVPWLLTLNNELRSALTGMLIPRERLFLGQAIGKGMSSG